MSIRIVAAIGGDARESRVRDRLLRIKLNGAPEAAFGFRDCAEREHRVATARMRKGEIRVQAQQRLKLPERCGRALEPQQAEPECVAQAEIIGPRPHRLLEQGKRLGGLARLIERERRDVIEQGMLEPLRERLLRKLARPHMLAALRRLVHEAHGCAVSFGITCHGSSGRLLGPHALQVLDHVVELGSIAPVHLERLEGAHFVERMQHVAL